MRVSSAIVLVAIASSASLGVAQPVDVSGNADFREIRALQDRMIISRSHFDVRSPGGLARRAMWDKLIKWFSENPKLTLGAVGGIGFFQSITRRDDSSSAARDHLTDEEDDILRRAKSDNEGDPSHGREPGAILSARDEDLVSPVVVMLVPPPLKQAGARVVGDVIQHQQTQLHRRFSASEPARLEERGAFMNLVNAGTIAWAVGEVGGRMLKKLLHGGRLF